MSLYILFGIDDAGSLRVVRSSQPGAGHFHMGEPIEDDESAQASVLDAATTVGSDYREMRLLTVASTLEWRTDRVVLEARLARGERDDG